MGIRSTKFGTVGDRDVELYTLTNANGLVLEVITYGAIVRRLEVPDREGKLADVVLGFDDLASYTAGSPYFGAICGRCSNRIRAGRFELDGRDVPPSKIVNRFVRPVLGLLAGLGLPAGYFGRHFISVSSRAVASASARSTGPKRGCVRAWRMNAAQ